MIQVDAKGLMQFINPNFVPIMTNKDRYFVLIGGAGSGKSVAVAQKLILRILKGMSKKKKHKFLCLRKTGPAAGNSIYPLLKDILNQWNLQRLYKVNKTTMSFHFVGGSEILCTGLDDPEKIKSIHGITGVWLEEATEFTHDDFKQLDLRVRGFTWDYKQLILSFNPIDENHWIRQKLFSDDIQAEIEAENQFARKEMTQEVDNKKITYAMSVMHSTYRDNEFLDDVYKARLENLINEDSNYYDIYCRGVWGVLKGLIFEHWEQCDVWPQDFDVSGYGIDFGFSVNPSSIVEAGFRGNDLYLREHCYKVGMTNKEIAVTLFGITHGRMEKPTVADSAEPKSIAEIRSLGHPCMPSVKGKDSVVFGIQRMKQYRILIYRESTNLIKELQGYKWATDRDGTPLNMPVKFNDHLIDAARYIITKLKGVPASLEIIDGSDGKQDFVEAANRETTPGDFAVDEDNDDIWQDF